MRENIEHRRSRGFTLLELIVVIGIVALLAAILIPAISRARTSAGLSAAKAQMQSLQTALETYYSDHRMYPPSHLPTGQTYGTINPRQGSVMLAQGLMGFLPGPKDGAGPPDVNTTPTDNTPAFGFRTRSSQMGGRIYGPYIKPTPSSYVRSKPPPPNATPQPAGIQECFIDAWGRDIVYFRGRGLPDPKAFPQTFIHDNPPVNQENNLTAAFFSEDNADTLIAPPGSASLMTAPIEFLKMLYPSSSPTYPRLYTGGQIVGADSYIIVSAGPDEEYFSKNGDDIILSKP